MSLLDLVRLGTLGCPRSNSRRRPRHLLHDRVSLTGNLSRLLVANKPCSCISSRRRRKAGRKPFYGTGWAGNVRPFGGQQQYNPNYNTQQPQYGYQGYNNNNAAPPNYNQSTGGYYGQQQGGEAQSYFNGQRGDMEMQAPGNTYAPPAGPPPGKGGIVR